MVELAQKRRAGHDDGLVPANCTLLKKRKHTRSLERTPSDRRIWLSTTYWYYRISVRSGGKHQKFTARDYYIELNVGRRGR